MQIDKIKDRLLKGNYLIVICGPTAVGKTSLAIELAGILDTDIISFDSMQVYKGLDIGTDKYKERNKKINQYMVDLFEPDYQMTVIGFRDICRKVIEDFFDKDKIPLLVGGSGLYLKAVLEDLDFTGGKNHAENLYRKEIKDDIKKQGIESIYQRLKDIDPSYADKISQNDEKRIIRALEVYMATGRPFSSFHRGFRDRTSIYNNILIGLDADRQFLYEKINNRVENMIENGLIDEVRSLKQKGYDKHNSLKQAVGYKETLQYLENKNIDKEALIEKIKMDTRRLAKKQLTWFKRDRRINWLRVDEYDNILDLIKEIIDLLDRKTKA